MDNPIAYTLNHEGFFLNIALIETTKLKLHEETIPWRLTNLQRRIKRDGIQSSPVLVDQKHLVVLDGMHRTEALIQLKCKYICVCYLNYLDPRITVQRWCRVIPDPFTEKKAKTFLNPLDLRMEPYETHENPNTDPGFHIVFQDTAYKLIDNTSNLIEVFKKSNQLENSLIEYGYEIKHCTEAQAAEYMASGYAATLYTPRVKKQQVLELATGNQVLTPKATRHRIPARPLNVNVPLTLLRNKEINLIEANKQLTQHLESKKLTRRDQGEQWMGRTYDEVLYLFS